MFIGRPRDSALALVCAIAIGGIVVNSLYLQPGPHPAPIFVLRPLPVVDEPTGGVTLPRPRPTEAPQPDVRLEPKPRAEVVTPTPVKSAAAVPARPATPRHDPIGDLLTGGNQLSNIQRALSE